MQRTRRRKPAEGAGLSRAFDGGLTSPPSRSSGEGRLCPAQARPSLARARSLPLAAPGRPPRGCGSGSGRTSRGRARPGAPPAGGGGGTDTHTYTRQAARLPLPPFLSPPGPPGLPRSSLPRRSPALPRPSPEAARETPPPPHTFPATAEASPRPPEEGRARRGNPRWKPPSLPPLPDGPGPP